MSQRVLITGGASGLGREMARQWVASGARVAVGDLNTERLEETRAELGDGVLTLTLDVTKDADWASAVATLEEQWGGLDVVVNNAGIASGGPLQTESIATWHRVLEINLLGVVRGCQATLPLLRKSHGHILNVASMAGLIHPPMMGSYNAVKAAVVAYSETLSFELEDDGVDVHVLCPGFFKTNLVESLGERSPTMQAMLGRIFDKARVTAADVARAAIQGVDNGTFMILSHADGRQAHRIKRLFPSTVYRKLMRKQTAGMVKAWRKDNP